MGLKGSISDLLMNLMALFSADIWHYLVVVVDDDIDSCLVAGTGSYTVVTAGFFDVLVDVDKGQPFHEMLGLHSVPPLLAEKNIINQKSSFIFCL